MPIPVLNENQMTALKGVLNGGKTIDLTGGGGSSTRLPTMPEEAEVIVKGSSYNGPFAVRKVGEVMVDISSGEIIPSESGTISAALVTTVVGLLVAIPGVVAFNRMNATITSLKSEMEGFADELIGRIACEFQGRGA